MIQRTELEIAAATPTRVKLGGTECLAGPLTLEGYASLSAYLRGKATDPSQPTDVITPEGVATLFSTPEGRAEVIREVLSVYHNIDAAKAKVLHAIATPKQWEAFVNVAFESDLSGPKAETGAGLEAGTPLTGAP